MNCSCTSPLLVAKVNFDESVYRDYGFQRTLNLKWKLEDIIDSFLVTNCEAHDLIEELYDEIQKNKK